VFVGRTPSRWFPRPVWPISEQDRRDASSVTPRRLREERVLHSPARIWAGEPCPLAALSGRHGPTKLFAATQERTLVARMRAVDSDRTIRNA